MLNTFDDETTRRFAACMVDDMIENAQTLGCPYGEPKNKEPLFRFGKLLDCLKAKGYDAGSPSRVCHIKAKQRG